MSFIEILLLAIALAMDAFAVSLAYGFAKAKADLRGALILGAAFGGFQALMPIAGFYLSSFAYDYIACVDHWIAFGLLAFIGGKMIYESFENSPDEDSSLLKLKFSTVIVLAIATSIDALAVGISFACLKTEIFRPALIIGVVTFIISFFGVISGAKLGEKIGKRAEMFGGVVLVLIGLRILFCS